MRLSPLDPMQFGIIAMIGLAKLGLGRFEEAVIEARKSIGQHPTFMPAHCCLVSALAHLGREEETGKAVHKILEIKPDFRISSRSSHWPARYAEGLRKAGLRE